MSLLRLTLPAWLFCCVGLWGGCPGDDGAVRLVVTNAVDLSPKLLGYGASNAAASTDAAGVVHLLATSNQGELTLRLQGPLTVGAAFDLGPGASQLDFVLGEAAFAAQSGRLEVESLDPLVLSLAGVTMVARSAAARGQFVFSGYGTFR